VKAVAIQLRPTANWPMPKPQPMSNARRRLGAREMSSHKTAKASGINGHQPKGWKANAEPAPRSSAKRKVKKENSSLRA
jgi:hypothetical protein